MSIYKCEIQNFTFIESKILAMTKYHLFNNTKYSDKVIEVVRIGTWERLSSHFVGGRFDTDYMTVKFNVDGNHLEYNIGKIGPGNFYLKNDGLYSSKGKLASWWQLNFSIKDMGFTYNNL